MNITNEGVLLVSLGIILLGILYFVLPTKKEKLEKLEDNDVNNFFFGGANLKYTETLPADWGKMNFQKNVKKPNKVVNKTVNKKLITKNKTTVKVAKKK